ncbi:MAG: hypothetical protein SNI87_06150 [Rikenellaceae bacterium]
MAQGLQEFRIDYTYGIAIKPQDSTYALFNREYMPLGEEFIDKHKFKFQQNECISQDLVDTLQGYASKHSDMAMQRENSSDGTTIYKLFLYGDSTNPYIRESFDSKLHGIYMKRLEYLADALNVHISDMHF